MSEVLTQRFFYKCVTYILSNILLQSWYESWNFKICLKMYLKNQHIENLLMYKVA